MTGAENGAGPLPRSSRATLTAGALIAIVAGLAYYNALRGPLVFDDVRTVIENPSIRSLSSLGRVLQPPPDVFTAGRPVLNLSFALNYAVSGTSVLGYHVVNVAIHAAAAFLLFALARRWMAPRQSSPRLATPLALTLALLWVAHPLATNAVTYISQRAESLAALGALTTLYCLTRSMASARQHLWEAAGVAACAAAMATKEVMVALPIIVLLADRTFHAGTVRAALRQRPGFYAGLAATWLLLAWLMASSHLSTRDVGFQGAYSVGAYLRIECVAVVRYLALACWPHPLVFDYGAEIAAPTFATLIAAIAVLLAIVWLALRGLRERSASGFLAATIFLLLAPSSSLVPVQEQPIAESRMYLALAAVVSIGGLAAYRLLGQRTFAIAAPLAAALVLTTTARNRTYQSERQLWQDTVAKRAGSSRAHDTLAALLLDPPADLRGAAQHAEAALRIKPGFPHAHYNLAVAWSRDPARRADAIGHFEAALRGRPNYPEAHNNLANLLALDPSRRDAAIAHYEQALQLNPRFAGAHNNLAGVLATDPARQRDAIAHYRAALAIDPGLVEAHYNLANLLASDPAQVSERIRHYEAALQLRPTLTGALLNLGAILAEIPGREGEAVRYFERAIAAAPDNAAAHFNLATTLLRVPGRQADAISHYREVLRMRPDLEAAREMLRQLNASP